MACQNRRRRRPDRPLFKCCVLQEAAEVAEEGKFIANHADGRGGDCRGEAVSKLQALLYAA